MNFILHDGTKLSWIPVKVLEGGVSAFFSTSLHRAAKNACLLSQSREESPGPRHHAGDPAPVDSPERR